MASSIPARWRTFAEELLRDPNGARAARAVGVKPSNAKRWATRTRQDPRFQAYYAERLQEAEQDAKIHTHRVLEELALIEHSSIDDYVIDYETETVCVKDGLPPERIRAIASVKFRRVESFDHGEPRTTVTCEIKLWDKMAAITNAMKHKALLVERHEHTGPNGDAIPHVVSIRFVEPAHAD